MGEIEDKQKEIEDMEEEEEDESPKEPELIKSANTSAERLEKATEEQKAENDRTEKLIAERRLGGRAEAGGMNNERTDAQKKDDNAQEFFEGTALGNDIKKANE